MKKKLVSIILVNYGDPKDTLACLDSLKTVSYRKLEVVVVDNGAETYREDLFRSHYPTCLFIHRVENGGFAAGVNSGIAASSGEYVMLLNNDTLVTPGFIEPLVNAMNENKNVGIVSPQIRYYSNKNLIQYAGASNIHPILARGKKIGFRMPVSEKYNKDGFTDLCNGACMLIHRHVLEDVGQFSERYFMYYEEHDFTHKAKSLGWQCYYTGSSVIFHKASATIGENSPLKTYYIFRNRLLYQRIFQSGISLLVSSLFLLLVVFPKSIIQKLLTKDTAGAASILKAYAWHFKNHSIKAS